MRDYAPRILHGFVDGSDALVLDLYRPIRVTGDFVGYDPEPLLGVDSVKLPEGSGDGDDEDVSSGPFPGTNINSHLFKPVRRIDKFTGVWNICLAGVFRDPVVSVIMPRFQVAVIDVVVISPDPFAMPYDFARSPEDAV